MLQMAVFEAGTTRYTCVYPFMVKLLSLDVRLAKATKVTWDFRMLAAYSAESGTVAVTCGTRTSPDITTTAH